MVTATVWEKSACTPIPIYGGAYVSRAASTRYRQTLWVPRTPSMDARSRSARLLASGAARLVPGIAVTAGSSWRPKHRVHHDRIIPRWESFYPPSSPFGINCLRQCGPEAAEVPPDRLLRRAHPRFNPAVGSRAPAVLLDVLTDCGDSLLNPAVPHVRVTGPRRVTKFAAQEQERRGHLRSHGRAAGRRRPSA